MPPSKLDPASQKPSRAPSPVRDDWNEGDFLLVSSDGREFRVDSNVLFWARWAEIFTLHSLQLCEAGL